MKREQKSKQYFKELDFTSLPTPELISLKARNEDRKQTTESLESPSTFSADKYESNKKLYEQYVIEGKLDQYKGKWIAFTPTSIQEFNSREFAVVNAIPNAYVNRVGYEVEEQQQLDHFVKTAKILSLPVVT